jgi:hypothetical protein
VDNQQYHGLNSTALFPQSFSQGHSRSRSASFAPNAHAPNTFPSTFETDPTGHLALPAQGHTRHMSLGQTLAPFSSSVPFPVRASPRMSPFAQDIMEVHETHDRPLSFATPGGLDAEQLAMALLAEYEGKGGRRSRNVCVVLPCACVC